jgi:RNA 3'-terminal phosphate cyclase
MIETAKAALTKYTGDVYVYGDHYKGKESGNSSGFGLTVVAETTSGALLSSELVAKPQQLPEDVRFPHFCSACVPFHPPPSPFDSFVCSWLKNALITC